MGVALSICLTGVWTRAAHTSLPTIQYALNYCYTLSRNVYEEKYQSTHSVSYMNIVLQSTFYIQLHNNYAKGWDPLLQQHWSKLLGWCGTGVSDTST